MLSSRRAILMGVRISFDALRLCLLVAAGVTSGYLWRAAFESSAPAEQHLAGGPGIVAKAPAPRVVRIAPHHSTASRRPVAKHHVARPVVIRVTHSAASVVTSTHVASSPPPAATPTSRPPKTTPKPTPKPSPTPTPPPPTTTTTPPPAATSTPVAAPVQQVVAPPPPPPVKAPDEDETRPGNGNGDKNHEHTGPGGKDK